MFDGSHETELKGSWELAENRPGASPDPGGPG
jgi:hypothetical protein